MNHEKEVNPGVGTQGEKAEANNNLFSSYKKYTALTEQEREEIYKYCIDGLYVTRVLLDELAKNGHKAARETAIQYYLNYLEDPQYPTTKDWFTEVCAHVVSSKAVFDTHDYLKRTEKAIKARLEVVER